MKIELKNIQHSEALSEETNAFSASLYINDIKAGTASNRGHGGPTDYHALNERGRQLIKEAEEYCKTLPPEKFTAGGEEHTLDSNLEVYIDNLLQKHLEQKDLQKFRNKLDKAIQQTIVFGIPDQSYSKLRLKFPVDLILAHPNGKNILTDILIRRVKPELKEGEVILNNNIPESILRNAGFKPEQYVKPSESMSLKKRVQKKKGRRL
jgi:hypothetical protein